MSLTLHIAPLLDLLRAHYPEAFANGLSHERPVRIRSGADFEESRLKRELSASVDGWDVVVTHDVDERLYEIAIFQVGNGA